MASTELIRRRMQMGKEALSVELVNDRYIHTDGIISRLEGWFYTTPIAVKAGQEVSFSANAGASSAAISTYSNGAYAMQVKGGGSARYETYTYIPAEDCLVVVCARRREIAPILTIDGENVLLIGY